MKYEIVEFSQQSWDFVVNPAIAPQLQHLKHAINRGWKPANKAEAELINNALKWDTSSELAKVLKLVMAQKWPSWDGKKEVRFSEMQAKTIIVGWCLNLEVEIEPSTHVNFLLDAMGSGTEAYIEFARVAYFCTSKERQID